jgi:Tfp pilus assembly protein PilF
MTEAFPKSAAAFRTRGLVETKMDQYTDAVRSFNRAVELDPSSVDARLGLASAQWGAGMRMDAQAAFEALVKQHPRNAEVHETYGTLLLEGVPDDAAETRAAALLKTAVELDANRAEAHYQLGSLALKRDQTADALRHLEAAARLMPRESKIQFALARLYRRLGRADDSANAMRRYEELKTGEGRASPQAELRTQGK